jgi:hypothetical protein
MEPLPIGYCGFNLGSSVFGASRFVRAGAKELVEAAAYEGGGWEVVEWLQESGG